MDTTAIYIERLEQAVRVMTGLSEDERDHFDITVVAVRNDRGLRACTAGYCGLDPWFQAQGLYTYVDDDDGSTGDLSVGFASSLEHATHFFVAGTQFVFPMDTKTSLSPMPSPN